MLADPITIIEEQLTAFDQQWSKELRKYGFTQISNIFLERYSVMTPKLSHGEAMLVVHLMCFKWTSEAPFPSYRLLAERMGVSEPSVKRYVRALEKKNYLKRERRVGTTNRFHLKNLVQELDTIAKSLPPKGGGRTSTFP